MVVVVSAADVDVVVRSLLSPSLPSCMHQSASSPSPISKLVYGTTFALVVVFVFATPLHPPPPPPPPSPRGQAPLLEGHVRSEILLGVTILRPAEGDPTRTEMTTVRTEKRRNFPTTVIVMGLFGQRKKCRKH